WQRLSDQREEAQRAYQGLRGQQHAPAPPEVQRFKRSLTEAGVAHHLVADSIEITDERWRAAAEGVLRGARWVVVRDRATDEPRALALAEKERYRHYVVADAEAAPAQPPSGSLLSTLKLNAPVPSWLLRQLAQIRCVDGTEQGVTQGGEWITPQGYYRD